MIFFFQVSLTQQLSPLSKCKVCIPIQMVKCTLCNLVLIRFALLSPKLDKTRKRQLKHPLMIFSSLSLAQQNHQRCTLCIRLNKIVKALVSTKTIPKITLCTLNYHTYQTLHPGVTFTIKLNKN